MYQCIQEKQKAILMNATSGCEPIRDLILLSSILKQCRNNLSHFGKIVPTTIKAYGNVIG